VNSRWIDWEEEIFGCKVLQPMEVWEDVHRPIHSLGEMNIKSPEGVEDMDIGWLHKIEYSIKIIKLHFSQTWSGSCGDCSHEWLKEIAKIAADLYYEGLKVHQWLQNLYGLALIRWWK
jgi:hypothetical protein